MRNETTATGATDSRSVVLSKQLHVKSLPVVLSAVGREESVLEIYHKPQLVDPAFTERGHFISTGAEESSDGTPVAALGNDLFRFMAEAAVDQGHLSREGFRHVMTALDREVSRD